MTYNESAQFVTSIRFALGTRLFCVVFLQFIRFSGLTSLDTNSVGLNTGSKQQTASPANRMAGLAPEEMVLLGSFERPQQALRQITGATLKLS